MALLRILHRVEDQSVVGKGPVDLIGHRLLPRTRAVRSKDAGAVAPIAAEELSTQLGGLRRGRAHSEASSGAGGIAGLEETQALVLTLRLPRSSRDTVKERERERERERRVQYAFRYSTG